MNSKVSISVCIGLFMLIAATVAAQSKAKAVTVITSERMVYDSQKQSAVFEENVVVKDPQINLTADKLTAEFDANSKVQYLRAEGSVYIEQDDKKAWADSASYDIASGKVVLKGDPVIRRGRDMLRGDTITFWRDESRMVCEPNARLTIYSQDMQMREEVEGKK